MQDCKSVDITEEELKQFNSFKRQKKIDEAKSAAGKLELDFPAPVIDKSAMRSSVTEALRLGLGAVCVPPVYVRFCRSAIAGGNLKVIACVSCPDGADVTAIKVKAIKRAIADGADEVEVAAPLSFISQSNWGYVKREFKKIKKAAKKHAARVIIEAPLFGDEQIKKCCALAGDAGISCVRATGERHGAANAQRDIRLISSASKDKFIIKGSGVKDADDFFEQLNLGASIVSSPAALQIASDILTSAST